MILTTEKQQLDFLNGCYRHINRIYSTYLTGSEKQDASPNAFHNKPYLNESDEKLARKLPQSIIFGDLLSNITMSKLYLLVSIYNEAAKKVVAHEPIDLVTLFSKIKHGLDSQLNDINDKIYTDSNRLMRTHRSNFFRTGFFSFLARLFSPRSEVFLEKYGFFESKSELPLSEFSRKQCDSEFIRKEEIGQILQQQLENSIDSKQEVLAELQKNQFQSDTLLKQNKLLEDALSKLNEKNKTLQQENQELRQYLIQVIQKIKRESPQQVDDTASSISSVVSKDTAPATLSIFSILDRGCNRLFNKSQSNNDRGSQDLVQHPTKITCGSNGAG